MTAKPDDVALTEWKRQFDASLRMVEAMVEGSRKMCETQLEAAIEAHARAEATRQLLARTVDARELWKIQSEWVAANVEKSLSCWQGLCQTALETESCVVNCLCQQEGAFGSQAPAALAAASQAPLVQMMDTAYKQWQETIRQFYAAPMISQPEAREAA